MTTLKIIFRRARTLLWTAFSILVILAAVGVGLGKLLMPYSDRYQPQLEAWLSEEFGQQVILESFEGDWTAFGPRLSLKGMKLLPYTPGPGDIPQEAAAEVVIESAALDIKPLNALLPGFPLYNFRVIGADFELSRTADGQFRLSGFGVSRRGSGEQGSALKELARVGEVILEDSSLTYEDEEYEIHLGFSGIQGRLHLEGDELSTEIEATLFDSRSELVYGEIDTTLRITLGDDQKVIQATWQATMRELMLAALQGKLPPNPFLPLTGWLNAELWGEWSTQVGHEVKGVADVRDAIMVNEYQDLVLERVNSRFRWDFSGKGRWNLHLADFLYDDGVNAWTSARVSIARNKSEDLGLWISANELPLGLPLNLARDVMSIYGTAWPAFLPRTADGEVSELDLVLNSAWRLKFANGQLRNASVSDWDRWPDLAGLEGSVALGAGSGSLQLSGKEVVVNWPRMFREPLILAIPECELDVSWGQKWQVALGNCGIQNEDLAAGGEIVISKNEGKPAVDVNVAVYRANAGRLDAYWPEAILKDNIKAWLRKSLLAGEIVSGRFQIHGDMDDWPFRQGEGRFEALAEVTGGHVDFLEGWPDAQQVNAVAHFVGPSMDIRGSVGNIGGAEAGSVSARIADLKSPLLEMGFNSASDLPLLLGFLRQTPLQEQIQLDLSQFEFSGKALSDGSMKIPLGKSTQNSTVDGRVGLQDARFSDPVTELTLEHIGGELQFSEKGFRGTALDAEFRGHPAKLDLFANVDSEEKFRADLEGVFNVRDVIPEFLLEDFQALSQIQGDSSWLVSLVVAPLEDPNENEAIMTVESVLEGVTLDLPAPMNKRAADRWPLALRYPLSGPHRMLDVVFDERLSMRFDLPGGATAPRSASIRLGRGLPSMPADGFIRIEGEPGFVDLDGWLEVIIEEVMQGTGMGSLALESGKLSAGQVLFLDRIFDEVGMTFNVVDEDIRAEFSAEDINGKVRFTTGESGTNSLSAEFERLMLGEPVSKGVDMETDPSDLPALHLYVKSFSYAGVELGETRIEAYPTSNGFHFEKVDASSDRLSVQASGDWLLDEAGHRSDFYIHMASESLGDFLQSMDISSPVQGGQTLVDFNAWWPGSPAAFGLSRLNGKVEFSVVNGNITHASAGTGRLLGLLSVQALPKRLSLDFRDVFDSGFSFDEATGTFKMENGMASTEDVLLKSTSASISVSGRTDLVAREYDQLLTIRPGVGNTLPIIGALAAGPGGAAAGLALQGLLHDQLAEATEVRYTITGGWDDPKFEAVDVERAGG